MKPKPFHALKRSILTAPIYEGSRPRVCPFCAGPVPVGKLKKCGRPDCERAYRVEYQAAYAQERLRSRRNVQRIGRELYWLEQRAAFLVARALRSVSEGSR